MKFKLYALLLVAAMLLAACGGAVDADSPMDSDDSTMMENETGDKPMEEASDEMMDDESSSDEMMEADDHADEMMEDESSGDDMMEADDQTDEMMDDESSSDDMMDDKSSGDEMMEADDHSDDAMMEEGKSSEGDMMDDGDHDDDAMMDDDSSDDMMPMIDLPTWFGAQLTDVNTGESFTVADLQGKVVLVETLAVWCSNCLRQQGEVQALHQLLGERDDFVSVGLDIDPNESNDILSGHTAKHNFDWVYAVAPREVAREIGQLYGDQFLNPPSTPMLIIDQHGETHLLPFGIKSAEELNTALEPFLSDGM